MKENSKELREQEASKVRNLECKTLAEEIKKRLIIAWAEWQPDYSGWLKWSSSLYAENATISAIGDTDQIFHDYQASMKDQRDACSMEMGPILNIIVENNVAALVYHMYLTPKNVPNAPTFDMYVTEYNTFEKVDGELMVTHLEVYSDGAGLNNQ